MFIAPMMHFQKARSSPLRQLRVVFDLPVEFRIRGEFPNLEGYFQIGSDVFEFREGF